MVAETTTELCLMLLSYISSRRGVGNWIMIMVVELFQLKPFGFDWIMLSVIGRFQWYACDTLRAYYLIMLVVIGELSTVRSGRSWTVLIAIGGAVEWIGVLEVAH